MRVIGEQSRKVVVLTKTTFESLRGGLPAEKNYLEYSRVDLRPVP